MHNNYLRNSGDNFHNCENIIVELRFGRFGFIFYNSSAGNNKLTIT